MFDPGGPRAYARRQWRPFLVRCLVLVAGVGGCQAVRGRSTGALADIDDSTYITIGIHDAEPIEAELGVVHGGRLLPDGSVVLADYVSPMVKVFDARGRYKVGFGESGRRTGQFLRVDAVAASDSIVAVADAQLRKVQFWRTDGHFIRIVDSLQFAPRAAFGLSANQWLFYGPADASGATISWIHCLRFANGRPQWSSGLVLAPANDALSSAIVAPAYARDEVLISYALGSDSLLVRAKCLDGKVRLMNISGPLESAVSVMRAAREGQFGGMAQVRAGTVISAVGSFGTRLKLITDDQALEVGTSTDAVILLDGRADVGVLLFRSTPVPHAVVIADRQLQKSHTHPLF